MQNYKNKQDQKHQANKLLFSDCWIIPHARTPKLLLGIVDRKKTLTGFNYQYLIPELFCLQNVLLLAIFPWKMILFALLRLKILSVPSLLLWVEITTPPEQGVLY